MGAEAPGMKLLTIGVLAVVAVGLLSAAVLIGVGGWLCKSALASAIP